MDWKKQIEIESKVINNIANRITDILDRDDSQEKKADKQFDRQDEIFEALGVGKKDKTKQFELSFGDTIYDKIKNKIALMITIARGEKNFSLINDFLKKFNININVEELVDREISEAALHPQPEEEVHGCIHMQNPENPLHNHHDCK